MKICKVSNLEEYKDFIRTLADQDQPVFVYISVDNPHLVGISSKDVLDPDECFNRLTQNPKDDIINEDEPLFDDDDDFDDTLLLIL